MIRFRFVYDLIVKRYYVTHNLFLANLKPNRLLLSIQSQMYPTFDISVRFFGIDWPHLFRISQSLIQRVEQLSETLLGTKSENLPPSSGNYN